MKRKVGVLTWHYYPNFGSALQAYALVRTIKKLGYKVDVINYRSAKYGITTTSKDYIRYIVSIVSKIFPRNVRKRFAYSFVAFRKKYLSETGVIYDKKLLAEKCDKYDILVCGSDQIWAPNVFNSVYMLDFADGDKKRKVSYAASVGLNEIPDNMKELYKTLLSDFSFISVREDLGQKCLMQACGIESKVVLDPTLLLDVSVYRRLQHKPDDINEPYIFCYFLNAEHNYRECVEKYAKDKQLKIYGVSLNKEDKWMTRVENIGPREFLYLVDNAETVFTDSYHGTIFSLLFHNEFYLFERFRNDDPICQNSRIIQLDKLFGINSRIIKADEDIGNTSPIDYINFELLLAAERDKSYGYLTEALK